MVMSSGKQFKRILPPPAPAPTAPVAATPARLWPAAPVAEPDEANEILVWDPCPVTRPSVATVEVPAPAGDFDRAAFVRDLIATTVPAPAAAPTAESTPAVSTPGRLPSVTKAFLLAGRAVLSVSNPKGEHYTYRIRGRENEWPIGSGQMQKSHFVSVKREGGRFPYRYVGLVNANGTIKCTAKSEYIPGSKEYDVVNWAVQAVFNGKMIPAGYEIRHVGKCGRCGRTLTDPQSIDRGIGPDCAEMMGIA